jgi:hypothetical protein
MANRPNWNKFHWAIFGWERLCNFELTDKRKIKDAKKIEKMPNNFQFVSNTFNAVLRLP